MGWYPVECDIQWYPAIKQVRKLKNSSQIILTPVGPTITLGGSNRNLHVVYSSRKQKMLMEMPLAQTTVKALAQNLRLLVLSLFLGPMREQLVDFDFHHLCTHVREGNREFLNSCKHQMVMLSVSNATLKVDHDDSSDPWWQFSAHRWHDQSVMCCPRHDLGIDPQLPLATRVDNSKWVLCDVRSKDSAASGFVQ